MKKLCLSFLISFVTASLFAQAWPPNDCCTATLLTSNAMFNTPQLAGPGKLEDIQNCSCLADGEHNTYWFRFDCLDFSNLEFVIRPEGSGTGDYDFAVFLDGCPCGGAAVPPPAQVSCDFTSATGPTGAGNPAQFGLPGAPNFQPAIPMLPGHTYVLVIDNKANMDGFTLGFSPGSLIGQLPKPGPGPLSGPAQVCVGGTGEFSVPDDPNKDFIWTIDHWYFPAAGSTSNFSYTFPTPGSYEVCVESITLDCYNSDPNCMTVEVTSLPVGEESGTICYPNPYVAPNGEEFFAPGVYTLNLTSYQGCDSIVLLTIEAFNPSLEIRSKTICSGDCFNFEGETICEEGVYEKIYQDQHGCDSVISLVLFEVPLEVKVAGVDTLDCIKTSLLLDASMSLVGGPSSYLWTNAAGDTLDTDSILFVNAPGIYTIAVTTTVDNKTCTEEKDIPIIADTAPPAGVVATGGIISCTSASVVIMGSSTSPNVTYSWTGPNGFFSNAQNPTVSAPGTYVLTVTGQNGCKTVANAQVVIVTETLTANATGGTINCYSSTVTLNGSTAAPGVNYVWQGPNSTMYFGPSPTVNVPGPYLLTVTDFNGCTGTAQATVTQDLVQPQAAATSDLVLNCNTTSVFLNGNGSSFGPQFSYLWTTLNGNIGAGANTLNPTANAPGNYTLTVTNNNNGCTQTAQAVVQQAPPVTAGINGQTNVACFGGNNGSAMAFGGGGNGIYSYTWSNMVMGSMVNGLSEGNYVVTITDGNNCSATTSVTIMQPPVLSANASATAQTVQGVNDGTASANPSGGTPGYSFVWSVGGATTATISGLAPGNYMVTVTDANGCQTVQTVTVNEIECFLTANTSQTNVSCNGLNNGTATVTLDNALEPYSFIWSNLQTSQSINGLSPGTYSVTATDANGCEVVSSLTINEPSALNVNATSTDQVIPGLNDGTATANPTGGTSPYTYLWSNGETTAAISGLPPDDYEVMVTDANGCQQSQTVTVEPYNCGVLLDIVATNVSCNGLADGQATALPTGGLAPFTFEWSNNETTPTIGNLPPGTYDVIVMDAGNCPAAGQVVVGEPPVLTLEATDVTPAACGSDNGMATVLADGGTPGYEYLWPNGETTNTVENLAEGIYSIAVTDANGCMTALDIEIETDLSTDIEPPVAIATDFTVELGQDGTATIAATDIDGGSTDNCEIASIELDITSFDCNVVGENIVTLTITDVGGNTSTATAIVTVEDNIVPTFDNCPSNLALPFCNPVAVFDISASDNCAIDVPLVQTSGLPSGSVFPAGETTTQTFEVTDAGGNTAVCSFEITVTEAISFNATEEDVSCFGEADGSITTNVSGGSPGYTYLWSNGSTAPSIDNLGPGVFTLSVTDDTGCESVQTYEVEEPTDLITTLVNIINETSNGNDGSVEVTVSGGVIPYTFQWVDSNNNVVGTTEDISGLVAGTYQLFATDANGCVTSSAYTIQGPNATNNPELDALIKIYPNPTNDWVTVEFIDLPITELEVTIHDVIGQLVTNQANAKVTGGKYHFDMGHFPEGIYLVKLNLQGEVITRRVVRVD